MEFSAITWGKKRVQKMCTLRTKKIIEKIKEKLNRDFPSDSMAKNPPANARDQLSIPYLGRSRMPPSNQARAPQLLSLCLEPVRCNF